MAGAGLLIVEDDPSVRRMLERGLTAEGFDIRSAPDGGRALAMVEEAAPELVVLDIAIPGLDGFDVCRRLRERGITGGVLMLTARDAIEDRVRGLQAGADDYVVKPFALEEVVARLRALLRRGRDLSSRISFGEITFDTSTKEILRAGGETVKLTVREAQLLELLMRNPRTVVSRETAIERIWGGAAEENVVDRYVARLRQKLEDPLIIRTVWGVGFILEP